MTTAKNAVFIGLKPESCYLLKGGWLLLGGIFLGRGMSKWHSATPPSRENPVHANEHTKHGSGWNVNF